ncbi:hypothetical protein NP493_849g01000 [Ridgeia piscesae]|uniref:Uncharacterized protein n=1 Tax=Ridgeia piscesae TaxID=27915 RepID=A0AAD9KM87_RIDPI|nr:hypothetical protein NP493_849g01000 [Ridgeia piscesae]
MQLCVYMTCESHVYKVTHRTRRCKSWSCGHNASSSLCLFFWSATE